MNSTEIEESRIYHELTDLIALLSPPHEYDEEASHWRNILREKLGPGRHRLLELGVGGGHNLSHLTSDFEFCVSDISPRMLEQCRLLNPRVELMVGDMRSIRIGRTFAAVLIHDAISYMLTEDDLRATFATVAHHLQPGGIFITSPDNFYEDFHGPRVEHWTNADGQRELTYIEYSHDPDVNDSTIETILMYFIRENGRLRIEHDRHVTGLFRRQVWIELLSTAGFNVEERMFTLSSLDHPYRLFVGTLRG